MRGPVNRRSRDDILLQFGLTLRRYRQQAGVSQEKLAAKAGLDRTYVGGVERGERNISLVNLVRIANALGAHPSQLLEDLGTESFAVTLKANPPTDEKA